MQTEMQFDKLVQLELDFSKRLNQISSIKEITAKLFKLVSCHCGECETDCGCVIRIEK